MLNYEGVQATHAMQVSYLVSAFISRLLKNHKRRSAVKQTNRFLTA